MAANNTMYEYLNWRGDLTFASDPFNEVDNVILAQLAYVDYEGIVSDDREDKIAIGDVCRLFWEMHTEEEIKEKGSFVRMSPKLLKPVAESRRFEKMMLTGYVNYVSTSSEAQMSAVQFELEDGSVYVAFRGTDETLVGWKEDFNLSFMSETEGQRLAVEYMKIHFRDTDLKLRVGGHSKGGNFAMYASAFSGPEVEKQIEEIYTNDGPGFRREITQTQEYQKILSKTIDIIPGDSVIGRIFCPDLTPIVVKSPALGIMQHDAMTWQIMGNRFVRTERTEGSEFVEKVMADWLSKIDDDARQIFVDQVFGVLQATGANTLKDIWTANPMDLAEAIQVVRKLPKDDQKEITQVITQLFRSGERTIYEQIENMENGVPEFIRKWAQKRGDDIDKKQNALSQALKQVEKAIEKEEASRKEKQALAESSQEEQMPEGSAKEEPVPTEASQEEQMPEGSAKEEPAPAEALQEQQDTAEPV